MSYDVQSLLDKLKKEGVELKEKKRSGPVAAQKRARARRKARGATRVADEDKKRLQRDTARLRELRRYDTLYGSWKMLRRAYRKETRDGRKHREFEISPEEWIILWLEAGNITLGDGVSVPAWKLRGRNFNKDVTLCRHSDQRGFHLDNLMVRYRGATLADGRKIKERLNLFEK